MEIKQKATMGSLGIVLYPFCLMFDPQIQYLGLVCTQKGAQVSCANRASLPPLGYLTYLPSRVNGFEILASSSSKEAVQASSCLLRTLKSVSFWVFKKR